MIIGLCGYARAGKDEAAKALVEIGFERVAFADKLRDFLYVLNPLVSGTTEMPVWLDYVIDRYGWDGYKETPWGQNIRELLQRLGTECGRELIGDNVWVDAALNKCSPFDNYVVTDCRFPNEAQAIKDRGGVIVRIKRPGVGPANSHASETSLDDWPFDAYVNNDSTIDQLHRMMYELARPHLARAY